MKRNIVNRRPVQRLSWKNNGGEGRKTRTTTRGPFVSRCALSPIWSVQPGIEKSRNPLGALYSLLLRRTSFAPGLRNGNLRKVE